MKDELKHKTVVASNWEEFDKKIDEFSKENVIVFQTDHGHIYSAAEDIFVKVWCHVFYKEREVSKESADAQVDIKPVDETKYIIKCTQCGFKFDFLHWRKCSNTGMKHGIEGVPEELKPNYEKVWGKSR